MVLSTQKILKGIYGLPQVGLIAKQLLQKYLAKHGYHQTKTTPRPWKYNTRPINISLVVDDFGIKNLKKTHADHLIKRLNLTTHVIKTGTAMYTADSPSNGKTKK